MTPLDTPAPDQRAVLELVLRQGRSYGALSELLAIPEREVRTRADAGVRALAGEPAADARAAAARSTRCGSPREGGAPRRLGLTQAPVGEDGILTTGGPQQGDEDEFPTWFATYENVLITRESSAKAQRPGPVVLEGTLPAAAG